MSGKSGRTMGDPLFFRSKFWDQGGGGGYNFFLKGNFFSAGEAGRNIAENRGSPRNLQKTCKYIHKTTVNI